MIQRTLVTLCAVLLLGSATTATNPRTIEVSVERTYAFPDAHVLVGVAVLGHHVGYIDGGWLIKRNSGGVLHIDWSRYGDWKGLTRTEQGPRDVSQAQLDAVLHVLEGLGFPASTMRSWRVPAPVGHDEFEEGDTVLTIGQILIDLGTLDEAESKLNTLENAYGADKGPFDAIPNTNVDFYGEPFFGIDCSARDAFLRGEAVDDARIVAAAISSKVHVSLDTPSVTVPDGQSVLCPVDRKPEFYRTSGPPYQVRQYVQELSNVRVTLAIAGTAGERPAATAASDLTQSSRDAGFNLAERYAGAFGKASVAVTADAIVVHLHYDLGFPTQKVYDPKGVADKVASVRALVKPADFVEIDNPGHYPQTRRLVDVYVLVRHSDAAKIAQVVQTWSRDGFYDVGTVTPFVQHCDLAKGEAVGRALDLSKRKADELAALLRTSSTGIGAARVSHSLSSTVCGLDPAASLADHVARLRGQDGLYLKIADPWTATFDAEVDAAWLLRGPGATQTLTSAAYDATVVGSKGDEGLMARAFTQAAREAVVDNDKITSIYEATSNTWGDHASAQVVVLRPTNH